MTHEHENRDCIVKLVCLSIQESAVLIYSAGKVNVPPAIAGYEPIGSILNLVVSASIKAAARLGSRLRS